MHTTEDSGVALTSGANWGPSCRLPFAPAALLTAPDDSPRPAQFFSTRSNEDTRRQRGRYTRHCSWWSSGRNFCHRAPSRRWIGGKMDTRKAPHSVVLRVALRNDLLVGSGLAPGATLAKSWPFRRMSRRVSAGYVGPRSLSTLVCTRSRRQSARPAQFFSTRSNEDTRRQRGRYTRHCSWWRVLGAPSATARHRDGGSTGKWTGTTRHTLSSFVWLAQRSAGWIWAGARRDAGQILAVSATIGPEVRLGHIPDVSTRFGGLHRPRSLSTVVCTRSRRQSERGRPAAEVFKTSGPTAGPALADLWTFRMRRGNMPLYPQRVSRGTTAGLGQRCPARTFRGQRRSAALERKRILVLQGRRTRQERLARHILDALDPSPRAMYSAFAVDRVVHTIDSVGLLLQLLKVWKRTGQRLALRSPISVARNSSLASRVLARSAWRFQATVWVCAVLPLSSEARGVPARIAAVRRGNLRPDSEHTPAHLLGIASGTTPSSCRSAEPALAQVKPDVPCAFCLQTAAISFFRYYLTAQSICSPQMQRGGHSAVVKANPRSTSFTAALDEAGTVAILPGWLVVGTAVYKSSGSSQTAY
ncbi:hypothetical protein MIND_00299400 [Mycena indigotica]|uniref:Uncharacterized protein n=1 Tax=Mycena indigotica TaxID=2126181 RepID=A0A8H6T1F9_9AGAR|nr:uncharacterized protein MIND_00299400 [Mycena indigotica]KAF7309291.1 hypothetical protein MIND_00299400 [Mycena indigotica]